MHPILLRIGPITLYSYGVMLVVAFLTATWLATRAAHQVPLPFRAINAEPLVDFISLSLLGGITGARLLYIALQWDYFKQFPQELPAIWHGGLVWYGGFLGGLVAGWWYVCAQRLNLLRVLDQFIPFGALGHAIGRIGCFLNGCCYGRPTASWCGVLFPDHREPRIPAQLIEAAGLAIIFLVLRRLQRPSILRRPGSVFGSYLIGYGVLRFGVEFFRGDQTPFWCGMTLQQLVSLGMIVAGGILLNRARKSHHGTNVPVRDRQRRGRAAA